MKTPCKDCKERYKLLERGLICHSYCKSYKEYTEHRQEVYKKRKDKVDYAVAKNEGYRRATNNRYEYETKRKGK